MNPLGLLLPALITLLKAPPLTWDGADIAAEEHLPGNNSGHYVLLEQPTATRIGGSVSCRQWSCTALIDVVTQFPTDCINSAPAEELATQIAARIEGDETTLVAPRLQLPAPYDCGPAQLVLHSELRESLGELVAVRRLLRYRWEVFYHTTRVAPQYTPIIGLGGPLPMALT